MFVILKFYVKKGGRKKDIGYRLIYCWRENKSDREREKVCIN